ncbi:MAG: hypothetical protein E6Q93_00140 [Burkholderiaceae bacterium]|nr:MAG: hypothetical protein E6Q93_00140 [Burkholderiaceae bacterium]
MHASRCQAQSGMSWDAAIAARAAANVSDADAPTRAARRRCQDDDGAERTRPAERRNPLVQAMTEALRSLMPADAKATDSDEVKDSAAAFAHELVDALRESGGRHHGWHHGHHGYDDLAQRLEKLATTLDQPAAAATKTESPASGNASSMSASLTTTSLNLSIDANGTSASLSVTTVDLQVSTQSGTAAQATDKTAAAATTRTESPLLAAFRKMMTALQPAGGNAATSASDTSDSSKLAAFLRQLASALRGGEAASGAGTATPPATSGSLLSLAA